MSNRKKSNDAIVLSSEHDGRGHLEGDVEPFLAEMLSLVYQYKRTIIACVLIAVVIGGVAAKISSPTYKAVGLIQIEENALGPTSALRDLSPLMDSSKDTSVSAEQEILASALVLGRVIKDLGLDIGAEPVRLPLLGPLVSMAIRDSEGLSRPHLGLSSYAWGGEKIEIESFQVPEALLNVPITLHVGDDETFVLMNGEVDVLLKGRVGVVSSAGGVSLKVRRLVANPGARFALVKRSLDESMAELLRAYSIKEKGKKSGILEVSYQGSDPSLIGTVLSHIMSSYVRQNADRKTAETENSLKFLDDQLPKLKKELEESEDSYNAYRRLRGSIDISIETQGLLNSIVEVDNEIEKIQLEREEQKQLFTAEHPRIKAIDSKLEKLRDRRAYFERGIEKLPSTQQTVLRLARDVEVKKNLYTGLLNTAQQLKVTNAGTIGNVRVIDEAMVLSKPVSMSATAKIVLSTLVGLVIGLLAAWVRRHLNVVVESPEDIEAELGVPVLASIPHSDIEAKAALAGNYAPLLVADSPEDIAAESIRSLRTMIHFSMVDAKSNSLLITGPSPGVGKTFVSTNLAAAIAQSGKRVVIVDADLRRGRLDKVFNLVRKYGVSDYIVNDLNIEDVIKPSSVLNLSVVTTGQIPPNPSELLLHSKFKQLLAVLSDKFDFVIVDAPPILAVIDAAIISEHVGATLMVARCSRHPMAELAQALRRLLQAGANINGFVFNDWTFSEQRYGYGRKGYVYQYTYK